MHSCVSGTLIKTDQFLDPKTNFNKSKRTEIIQNTLFDYNGSKVEINSRYLENPQIFGNISNT